MKNLSLRDSALRNPALRSSALHNSALRNPSLRLGAIAIDYVHRLRDEDRGQATVEYVGLVVVLGTGIGMIVAGLDTLGFVTKIGSKLIKGITGALDKIMPG